MVCYDFKALSFILLVISLNLRVVQGKECKELLLGQYLFIQIIFRIGPWVVNDIKRYKCSEPEIDPATQAEKGCRKNKTVPVPCFPAAGVECSGKLFTGNEIGFYKDVSCRYVGNKSFKTALLLSIFLGVFGIDRFYLGYPAIGLFKFCTLGFFMIFQLIDVILIATQVLKPADGSDYVIDYYGKRLHHITSNNETLYYPQNFL